MLCEQHQIWLNKSLIQITRKASRKSDIDEIVFIYNHPNGQKMITKCQLIQMKHFFRIHIKYIHAFPELTLNNTDIFRDFLSN